MMGYHTFDLVTVLHLGPISSDSGNKFNDEENAATQ